MKNNVVTLKTKTAPKPQGKLDNPYSSLKKNLRELRDLHYKLRLMLLELEELMDE